MGRKYEFQKTVSVDGVIHKGGEIIDEADIAEGSLTACLGVRYLAPYHEPAVVVIPAPEPVEPEPAPEPELEPTPEPVAAPEPEAVQPGPEPVSPPKSKRKHK